MNMESNNELKEINFEAVPFIISIAYLKLKTLILIIF